MLRLRKIFKIQNHLKIIIHFKNNCMKQIITHKIKIKKMMIFIIKTILCNINIVLLKVNLKNLIKHLL